MRKLIESTFVSLDGVVGSPEKWAMPFWDDENKKYALSRLSEIDAFLLGRVTYEKFAASWSQIKGDDYSTGSTASPSSSTRRLYGRPHGMPHSSKVPLPRKAPS